MASSYCAEPVLAIRNCVATSRLPPVGPENSSAGEAGSATFVSVTSRTSPSFVPCRVCVSPTPAPDDCCGDDRDGAGVCCGDACALGGDDACGCGDAGELARGEVNGAAAGDDGFDEHANSAPAGHARAATANAVAHRRRMTSPPLVVTESVLGTPPGGRIVHRIATATTVSAVPDSFVERPRLLADVDQLRPRGRAWRSSRVSDRSDCHPASAWCQRLRP